VPSLSGRVGTNGGVHRGTRGSRNLGRFGSNHLDAMPSATPSVWLTTAYAHRSLRPGLVVAATAEPTDALPKETIHWHASRAFVALRLRQLVHLRVGEGDITSEAGALHLVPVTRHHRRYSTFDSNAIERALQLFDPERHSRPLPIPIRAITLWHAGSLPAREEYAAIPVSAAWCRSEQRGIPGKAGGDWNHEIRWRLRRRARCLAPVTRLFPRAGFFRARDCGNEVRRDISGYETAFSAAAGTSEGRLPRRCPERSAIGFWVGPRSNAFRACHSVAASSV
jgi:hypothetical protein